jgi:hypothetical protein
MDQKKEKNMKPKKNNQVKKALTGLMMGLLFAILMTFGCGGGGSDSSSNDQPANANETGTLALSITDSPGDFIAYKVNITSILLTKANGAQVETMPLSTDIDFAQYSELTELFKVASVPVGSYNKVVLNLDYSNADIRVEGNTGQSVQATQIVDENGNPVTTISVAVYLEDQHPLIIVPGSPALLSIDFNLDVSNHVELLAGGGAKITVSPVLIADIQPSDKPNRLRGPLSSVNLSNSSFAIFIHPFRALFTGNHANGEMEITVTSDTEFNIDGNIYHGQAGLTALSSAGALSAVTAFGDLTISPLKFVATTVLVGQSVPGGIKDVVIGNVISRTGETITVRGAVFMKDEGAMGFNRNISVTLGPDTLYTKQLHASAVTAQDISVGQKMLISGTITNPEAGNNYVMNVTDYAAMLVTALLGRVNSLNDTQPRLSVDLDNENGIDLRNTGLFTFTGTGSSAPFIADPNNYRIDTGTLTVGSLSSGRPFKAMGFVNSFGKSELTDFNALTIIDLSNVRGLMNVDWGSGSSVALSEITSADLKLNLAVAGNYHRVNRAGAKIDLVLPDVPVIIPNALGLGAFVIFGADNSANLYLTFGSFTDALRASIDAGSQVKQIYAYGLYNDDSTTMTSGYIAVKLS